MNIVNLARWYGLVLSASLILNIQAARGQEFEILFYEGFENAGAIPSGWTQLFVYGSRTWRFENGGYAPPSAPTFRHPPMAHSGQYNALFQDQSIGPTRKLVTPNINLVPNGAPTIKPTLTFWHAQDSWAGATDELKVYYRRTSSSGWVLLDHYTQTTSNWELREILLPDDAKTETCQLAFEGKSNWGWGVCIDDVKIEERGRIDRKVESFSVVQKTSALPSGSTINIFGNLLILVTGNHLDIPINSIKINYTGTNIEDIDQISLYHTRDSTFSVKTKITTDISINGNEITFSPSFNLKTGNNYIWFAFDISDEAEHGNIVDFSIDANSVLLGDNSFPASPSDPSAFATIHESLFFTNFSTDEGWVRTNLWQIGVPQGLGIFDPDYAFSGSNVLATNLSGNYPPEISPDTRETAVTQPVNAKYYKNLNLNFRRWLNIDYFDKTSIRISNNDGITWNTIYQNNTSVLDRNWQPIKINISPWSTRKDNIQIMFSMDTTNYSTEYGGWNIDNFAITGEFIHSDVGVKGKILPVQQCGLTNQESVSVIVKNYGGRKVNVPFEVGYSINGGATYTKEWFTDAIASEVDDDGDDEMEFTFTTPADLSVPGLKNLVFRTFLNGDQDASNDSYSTTLYVFPTVVYPYQASFESTSSYWYPTGTNSSWQWGTPSGTINNKASHGTKVWATGLAQNYKNNELSYLESPCFDLTTAEYPVFSFDYIMHIEPGIDGMAVQYSVDGGPWVWLPAHGDYAFNWYDTGNVVALNSAGWSQNKTNYVTAKTLLPNDVIGSSSVKFRFVFASNPNNTYEGVALDMVKVYELPYDIGITELINPVSDCEIGSNVPLELKLECLGIRPIPAGTQIPLKAQANSGNLKSEIITLPDELSLSNPSLDYTTVNKFNLFKAGEHNILAYTDLAADDDRSNDTLKVEVSVLGMPGFTIGPDIGTMDPDSITLDAGAGYATYAWFKWDEVDTWDPVGTDQTYSVEVNGWGTYKIEITNSFSCFAKDSITIAQSDKDVGVLSINNLTDECLHSDPISPSVTLKFYGYAPFDGIESFPVVTEVDGVVELTEEFTPPLNWGDDVSNEEAVFTFTGTIDLSEAKDYNISIYTGYGLDLNRYNDTTSVQVSTWGLPNVTALVKKTASEYISADTIVTTSADTLTFKASDGFASYLWERQLPGQASWSPLASGQTLNLSTVSNNLISSRYRVTVSAYHGCGNDSDTIFVNASDLAIEAIQSPDATLCHSDNATPLSIVIKNKGRDTYPIGTAIEAFVSTPINDQSKTIILTNPFAPGEEMIYQFPQMELLPIGDNYISYSVAIENDPIPENNTMDLLTTVNPSPSVSITPSVLYKIFGPSESYEIEPEYSEDVTSFLWQDDSVDTIYTIYGSPAFENYTVIVENAYGCTDTANLRVIANDLAISQISSPKSDCILSDDTPVTFTIFNNGNTTYPTGHEINVELLVDGSPFADETIVLPSDLVSKASMTFSLVQSLDLSSVESATIQINISSALEEVYYTNNSMNKTVVPLGYPIITLGPDREVHAWEEILDPGYYNGYLWQDGSTERTFTATQSGTYSVTVTDFSGCQGDAEVTLTFFVDDIGVTDLLQPISACELTNSEIVEFTVKNMGTHTFTAGTPIDIGFSHDGQDHTETIYLEEDLAPDEELTVTCSETVNLSERKVHDITIWVEVENDMVSANNTETYQVNAYPDVDFSFNIAEGFYSNQPYILDAGAGYDSYLWQDGSTDQTFLVTETGLYSVTVTNEYGCVGYDEVFITILIPDYSITAITAPVSACQHSAAEQVTAYIGNVGTDTLWIGDELLLTLWLNGETVDTETFSVIQIIEPGGTLQFTFDQVIDLSGTGSYNVGVEVTHPLDQNVSNNLMTVSVETFPAPVVNLGGNQVSNTGPVILDAGPGFASYLWQNGSTAQTFTVTVTGTYSVTVTDYNGCQGSDEVHVAILIPDYGITDIISPVTSCQLTENESVIVEISNFGTDTLLIGDILPITLFLNGDEVVSEEYILPQRFEPGDVIEFTFTTTIDLSLAGEYTIAVQTDHPLDQTAANDQFTSDFEIYANPVVDLGPDQTINEPMVLDAGAGYVSYLWQDGSTGQTFTVTQTGLYHVTVTDENGCEGYDEVFIIYDDTPYIIISEVISPVDDCNRPNLPVEVILTNQGGGPVTPATPFQVVYKIGTMAQATETVTVSQPFNVGSYMNYTFNQGLNIAAGDYTINFWTIYEGQPSEQMVHNTTILPSPVFSLGPDSLKVEFPYVLIAGIDNVQYLWSNGSTESSITAYETGTYWLTVTNSYGCSASDTIYLYEGNWINIIPGSETLVKVYPNPVQKVLSVEVFPQQYGTFTFEIFSSLGGKLYHSKTQQGSQFVEEITMEGFSPGVYLLKVSNGGRWVTTRIVVNR